MTHTIENLSAVSAATAIVGRKPFTDAISIVSGVVERRTTVHVLSQVKLVGDGASLSITGTDLDMEVTATVPGVADETFASTYPAHQLKDMAKKACKGEHVAFTAGEFDITPESYANGTPRKVDQIRMAVADFGKVQYELDSCPVEDFPTLQAGKWSNMFMVAPPDLQAALPRVLPFISSEETRYYLNGAYMHRVDGILRFVATDGHKLAKQDCAAPIGSENMPDVILPTKLVKFVEKHMRGTEANGVEMAVSETRVMLAFTTKSGVRLQVTSKVIDGTFPDYNRVIPQDNDKRAVVPSADLQEAINSVKLVASDRSRGVKLGFSVGNLALTVNNPKGGNARASVPVEWSSDDFEIGFAYAYAYVETIIKTMASEAITLNFADPGDPTVITGSDAEGLTCVLMPMRM